MMKFAIATALLGLAASAQSATVISIEAPGAQSTTLTIGHIAVETFDDQTIGTVIPVNTSFAAIGVGSTFSATQVLAADQYGGAGGIGNQAAVRETGDLAIDFTGTPLNYFGVWASALDAANTVSFYLDGTLVSSTNLTAYTLSDAYRGNPTANFLGQNFGEKYAFFNFRVTGGYDRVVLSQNGGGGFELDNITIGSVPEASTWTMLIIGFGMVGFAARRRAAIAA